MNQAPITAKNPAITDAIDHFKTMSEMARSLGLSGHQVIQDWVRRGIVPAEHCPEIEKATGIRCECLNPKIDWTYLRGTAPELAQQNEVTA
ncbi:MULTISPECIES: transcriptional regulator [pseudomallei group]|uniref:transcriptional regulator n=1 Tax=pseudomallei group TaxID=111527 RepID=UPI000F084D9C|nr:MULTISPECIES: YdaS family helix-turn-helix protein [pseudomallei group]